MVAAPPRSTSQTHSREEKNTVNTHHSTTSNNSRARIRTPRALLTTPQQLPGYTPVISPAGLTKPGVKLHNPR
jgi:hypothetical protein